MLGSPEHSAGGRAISKECEKMQKENQKETNDFPFTHVSHSPVSLYADSPFFSRIPFYIGSSDVPSGTLSTTNKPLLWGSQLAYAYSAWDLVLCAAICQPSGHSPTLTEDTCTWPFFHLSSLTVGQPEFTQGDCSTLTVGLFGYKV